MGSKTESLLYGDHLSSNKRSRMKVVLYFIIASITLGAAVADQGEVNKRAENYIFCYENANLGGRHVLVHYTQTFVSAVDCCLGGEKSIAGINSNGIVAGKTVPNFQGNL